MQFWNCTVVDGLHTCTISYHCCIGEVRADVENHVSLNLIVKLQEKIWHMIRHISGKPTAAATSHLVVNNTTIEQLTEITWLHCIYYCSQLSKIQISTREAGRFFLDNLESYDLPCSMAELSSAIHKVHVSATGLDSIHYQMLKNLTELALNSFLRIFVLLVIFHNPSLRPPSFQSLNRRRTQLTLGMTVFVIFSLLLWPMSKLFLKSPQLCF